MFWGQAGIRGSLGGYLMSPSPSFYVFHLDGGFPMKFGRPSTDSFCYHGGQAGGGSVSRHAHGKSSQLRMREAKTGKEGKDWGSSVRFGGDFEHPCCPPASLFARMMPIPVEG